MGTTFNFDELDQPTHDYLMAVRDSDGSGAPGVFVSSTDNLPGCGCIAGPIIIVVTLLATLTTWFGIIFDDPIRVAFLQTGFLVLGVWLFLAAFRGTNKGGRKMAGCWVYADPLHLYQAFREQITITPIQDVHEANFTHNYNNGNYQNSVVNVSLSNNQAASVTLNNEARAEQMVVFLNYIAWARGPEGGARANYSPATLGALAKYVSRHDHEPLDADSNINLNLLELDIDHVPEAPMREGRALPSVFPYILLLIFGVSCFFIMKELNTVLRDDAIYDSVMKEPYVEPRYLRAYLLDERNTRHREAVTERLSKFYTMPIDHVTKNAQHKPLGGGMVKVLESLQTTNQPVISIHFIEMESPLGKQGGKPARETKLRTLFADGVNHAFSAFMPAVQPPPGIVFTDPQPVGAQLIAFVAKPDDAQEVHFDISYAIKSAEKNRYRIEAFVIIRADIEKPPVVTDRFSVPGTFTQAELDTVALTKFKEALIANLIGSAPDGKPLGAPK
ncbi:MAG: hypothetical protein L0241_15455 [Planctomycetia bacterium]|nr:hypothetical protein [Planctomycetia bacterium]